MDSSDKNQQLDKKINPSSSSENINEIKSDEKQARYILPSTDGSPPKIMTIKEVTDVVKNIQNMTLAHEIAVNPEFKLQPYEPPENSLEKRIKEVMHKAFWDVLREQLKKNPPCFDHAIQLLIDIKECFPQIIPGNNQRVLDHINEVLDPQLIRQQAEQNTLDFRSYANFVVQILAKSCAPVRDEQVAELSKIDDVADIFKGILDTMSIMKLDMANCLLEMSRNDLVANSVEYEKKKFKEYLEYYKFGFPITENWLKRNQLRDINGKLCSTVQTIFNAYIELLDCNELEDFPEILSVDKERLMKLSIEAIKLCICTSVTSIIFAVPNFANNWHIFKLLPEQILTILENINKKSELLNAIENVWLQVLSVIKNFCTENNIETLDQNTENTLKTQILRSTEKDSPVFNLMWKRLETYVRLVLRNSTNMTPPPPPGYQDIKEQLEKFAIAFKRLITFNYSVYGEYYDSILTI